MSLISACCNTQPVQAEYTPTGTKFHLKEDLECYAVGDKNAKAAIIYIYDIFTNHPNAYQGCDILASSGYRVIMPDFLRNDPPSMETLGDSASFMKYVEAKGTYKVLEEDFKLAKEYLTQQENFSNVFLIGFCWGAKMVMALSAHDSFYKGGALIHPSLLEFSDFENAQCPMVLLPSKDDRCFKEDYAILQTRPFGKHCVHKRYDDMIHGWCAARGEWADSHIASQANDAFSTVITAFNQMI
ncbi:hypothetical protein BB561_004954 [Smittium simulii]|uniref:Dienelactone hydrolase domain-containing protein n=1 Tax=Smittium simulii TaxID=133385 RepID=A0A2T9YD28_9FUNG|nr:hypothetical protein BB561_004954 [Smittium simulii]